MLGRRTAALLPLAALALRPSRGAALSRAWLVFFERGATLTSARGFEIVQQFAVHWHRLARGEERNWMPPYEPVAPIAAPILVAGHTDAEEARSGLAALGAARAEAVAARLRALGVPPGLITAEGFGADRPLVPTGDPEPQNRRVDLVIR